MTFDSEAHLAAAEAAREAEEQASPIEKLTVLTFAWASDWYALPLVTVREVIELKHVTPIPGLPAHMLGATSHRGEVMAVIDPRPVLGLKPGVVKASSFLTVINVGNELAGLLVDAVGDIHDVTPVINHTTPEDGGVGGGISNSSVFTPVVMLFDESQRLTLIDSQQLVDRILFTPDDASA